MVTQMLDNQAFITRTHSAITGERNSDNHHCQPLFMQSALWNFVIETVGDYPKQHISEKTIKAILTKRPFIINGAQNTLSLLKDLGFKTFNHLIDESFDTIENHQDRMDRILQIVEDLCKQDLDQFLSHYLAWYELPLVA